MKKITGKLIAIFVLCVTVASLCCATAFAEESAEEKLEEEIEDKLDDLDLSGLESWLDEYGKGDVAANGFIEAVKEIIAGRYDNDAGAFFNAAVSLASGAVKDSLPALIAIFAIALLYSVVGGLSGGFLKKSTTELIYFACYAAMISIVVAKTASLLVSATETVKSMQALMNAAFPVLLTLLTALGSVTSASVYRPMTAVLATGVTSVVTSVVLPLFIAATTVGIIGHLSKNVKLSKLTTFFKSCADFILGGIFGIFATFLSVQGLTGAIADTVSVKTAKFALQSYVPLLGGYLSDGFDLVLAGLVLIKNSAGLVVTLLILSAIIVPVVEIAVFSLGLKLVGGLIEPFSDERFSAMLGGVSKNLGVLIAIVLGVGFMFILTVMLVVATCNAGVV